MGRALVAAVVGAVLAQASAVPVAAQPNLDAFGLLVAVQSRPSLAVVGAGARAAGMGGAFTALADDASAASFNPAGLALLLEPEATIAFDRLERTDAHGAFTDVEDGVLESYGASRSEFDALGLNFLSATYPWLVAGRNLSLQISFHRAFDFSFESERRFDESVGGVPVATIEQLIDQNGGVDTLSLAAAYQLTPRTALGLTVSRWTGDWTFSTLTRETDVDGDSSSLRFVQDNSWSGWNVSAGLLLRYRYLNIGVTGRTPFTGDLDVSSRLETDFATPFPDASTTDATLRWPASWTVGLAVKPLDTWVVTVDSSEFDWDDMVITGLAEEPVNFFDLRPEGESRVSHTNQWRYGTEYSFFAGRHLLSLRGGWFDLARPLPTAPAEGPGRGSRQGFALGLGWKVGDVALDLAYQRGASTTRQLQFVDPDTVATGVVDAQAAGTVDTTEERFFVSLLYRFPSRAAVSDLFHFLFVGPRGDGPGDSDGAASGSPGGREEP